MERRYFYARDIGGATEQIFDYIRRYRDKKVIYFNGWSCFGAAAVLRSIAQVLSSIKDKKTPPELCFDKIIYIDCSSWESRRAMQRKIAEELELDHETMAMLDKQDEEDDFNGVDQNSRDVIWSVSEVMSERLPRNCMLLFLNGSDDEVDLSRFGFNWFRNHLVVWTFKTKPLNIHVRYDKTASKLRYTHLFLDFQGEAYDLTCSEFCAILCEEASSMIARHPCIQDIDPIMVRDCSLYELFLHCSFHSTTGFDWAAHASNFWACDGLLSCDRTRVTNNTLHQEIRWDKRDIDASRLQNVFENLRKDRDTPFLVLGDGVVNKEVPYLWIFITSENKKVQEDVLQTMLGKASSLFIAFKISNDPQKLPSGILNHCRNLGVLVLSYCVFSFVSPPFLECHELRFLGLDHCTHDNNTREQENKTKWTRLQNLWVLDLRYTEWDDILSEEKMDIMVNLKELNIEGLMCWQLTGRLHGRLPHLQRLRIIKPTRKAERSTNGSYTFMDRAELEIFDLSGNAEMDNLSTSLSAASRLQMLILDGCDILESLVMPNGLSSSLRSFSFDGYGPATHWISSFQLTLENSELKRPTNASKRHIETSKISLQGCKHLDNLLVRGLPNLVELDLSGSAIKVLDLNTMVVDVPGLKRLFLVGCEYLRAIRWASIEQLNLELLCIDTRPQRAHGFTRSYFAQPKHFCLYATLADARLARSLSTLVKYYEGKRGYGHENIFFNIHITSSTEYGGGVVPFDASGKGMIEPSNQHRTVLASQYDDIIFKIDHALPLPFPQPPTKQSDNHIEISYGSSGLESELTYSQSIAYLMTDYTESLHVHDASTSAMAGGVWRRLKWCRMERCSNMATVFPKDADEYNKLEIIWALDLPMARNIWSKGSRAPPSFINLKHLHLHSCPRLQFVLPVWVASFPNLEILHITHCGDLGHVFVLDEEYPKVTTVHGVPFPKLTSIHLYNLPKLQQIMCDVKMVAPALETIWIRGCFSLRRLPALAGRKTGTRRPSVEIEKDVWDALEWDGPATGHHPDLFEPPVHSRYYRRRRLLRGTVLR